MGQEPRHHSRPDQGRRHYPANLPRPQVAEQALESCGTLGAKDQAESFRGQGEGEGVCEKGSCQGAKDAGEGRNDGPAHLAWLQRKEEGRSDVASKTSGGSTCQWKSWP